MKIVEVTWVDSTTHGAWDEPFSMSQEELTPILSVGYLLAKHKDRIIIVQSQADMDEGGRVSDALIIPRGCITKIRQLK